MTELERPINGVRGATAVAVERDTRSVGRAIKVTRRTSVKGRYYARRRARIMNAMFAVVRPDKASICRGAAAYCTGQPKQRGSI